MASIEPMQTGPLRPTFLAVYYQNINKEETAVWHDNDKKIQKILEGRKTNVNRADMPSRIFYQFGMRFLLILLY